VQSIKLVLVTALRRSQYFFLLQNLSLPVFEASTQEYGPVCVKSNQEYCVGNPRAYRRVGTVLNGSYQAPEFADMNGDGRPDLITSSAENNSVMIFYNQGYEKDGLPAFEASASVIVPSSRRVRALHAVYSYNGKSVATLCTALLRVGLSIAHRRCAISCLLIIIIPITSTG
jgi:hypothetical protein